VHCTGAPLPFCEKGGGGHVSQVIGRYFARVLESLRKESAVGTIKIAAEATPVACGAEGCVAE